MLRPGSAAHLVALLRKYILDPTSGPERLERCTSIANYRAKRKAGDAQLVLPKFWTHKTSGMKMITRRLAFSKSKSRTEVVWASPEFAWACFGKSIAKEDDARCSLRKLIEQLMPGYFALLGGRYGVDNLLAEGHQVMDLAFLAANWRYTKVVDKKFYRYGLEEWPPTGFLEEMGGAHEKAKVAA